jgi:hypothetical protein
MQVELATKDKSSVATALQTTKHSSSLFFKKNILVDACAVEPQASAWFSAT